MNFLVLTNIALTLLIVVPAILAATMMLDGRFSRARVWFRRAFALQVGIAMALVAQYLVQPDARQFADGLGILAMPSFRNFLLGSIAGGFAGSALVIIEDLFDRAIPDGDPKAREGLPKPEKSSDEANRSNVILLKRAS